MGVVMVVGDPVVFLVDGDGERLAGVVVAVNVSAVDGVSTVGMAEPVHLVSVDGGGCWAIHPSWIVD